MPPIIERLIGMVLCSAKYGDRAVRARHLVEISDEAENCEGLFICYGADEAGEHQVVVPMEVQRNGGIPVQGPLRRLDDLKEGRLAKSIHGSHELYRAQFDLTFRYWGITSDRFRELALANAPAA